MSSIKLSLLFFAFVSVPALGCTAGQSPATRLTQADAPRGCALGLAGSTVVAEDTPDGIALSFTSKDKPAEMRERANDAAAQHGPGQRLGIGHGGRHGDGADHGLQLLQAPAARSAADDIEGGARIRFVPADASEKELLRARLRERATAMNALSCN